MLALIASLTSRGALGQQSGDVIHGDLGRRADSLLTQAAKDGFSAVILIAKGDTILLRRGYGWADRGKKIPFSPNTIFDIGSITKQFTAAGILALEAQGKLSTKDPLSRYFPNAPADKARITLHQVMTHSAGFDDDFGPDYAVMSRDSLMRLVMARPLMFKPGKEWSYSNAGYSVMATIIEKVSGVPYETFLHDRLFARAAMATTGYTIPHWDLTRLSRGYGSRNDDQGTPLEKVWGADGPYWTLKGNGGILSTMDDMYRWHLTLRNRAVLPEAAMKKLEQGYVLEDPKDTTTRYGYGWEFDRGFRCAWLPGERRGYAELEPVEIVELEHANAPGAIRRLVDERSASRLDARRRRVHISRRRNVDLEIESLPLYTVPTQLAVVLIEHKAAVTGTHHGGRYVAFVLERLVHRQSDGIAVEVD